MFWAYYNDKYCRMSDAGSPVGSQILPKLQSFRATARQASQTGEGSGEGPQQAGSSAQGAALALTGPALTQAVQEANGDNSHNWLLDTATISGPAADQDPNKPSHLSQQIKDFPVKPMLGGTKGIKVTIKTDLL
jgi:hypothetical protein